MYDVTIIGAGLAGLQLARLLACGGASVLLVDARRNVTDCVRTTGIFVRRTFEDFPALDPFLGSPIRSIGIHSPAGRSIELASERDEFRVGRMKPLVESLLQQAVGAGATWSRATTYTGLLREKEFLHVFLRDRSVKTRFIVGADGARSRVAADLRLDQNDAWIVGVENVYRSTTAGEPRFDCWIDPAIAPGYLAWLIDDGEEIHAGVGGHADRFDPSSALKLFETRLRHENRLSATTLIEKRGGLIPVNGVLRRIGSDCGLLVGDAAGAVSPLTAGGLDACMRLSAHAADRILDALRNGAPLAGYDGSAFRSRFSSRIVMRRAFDIATRSPAAIETGFALARTNIASRFVRHVFFGRGSFPDTAPEPATSAAYDTR